MTVDIFVSPSRPGDLLPGNKHYYDRPNGRVTGADLFRVRMTVIVPAGPSQAREDLEKYTLCPEHHLPAGVPYGLALLESQELSAMMMVGAPAVEAHRTGKALVADPANPVYGGWPHSGCWEDLLPDTTWHPGGEGVLARYDGVDGASVTVFEYMIDEARQFNDRAEPVGKMVPMVSYHCDRCHTPSPFDLGERFRNTRANDRTWAGHKARAHARGADRRCTIPDGRIERVVSQVASEMRGTRVQLPPRAVRCAAEEGCAQVAVARSATARLLAETAASPSQA